MERRSRNGAANLLDVTVNTFFTADWHLGEDRFDLIDRPGFKSAQDMVDELVRFHNERVDVNDLVYVVGDVCYHKTPDFLEQVKRFNGDKVLIRGNHDRRFSDSDLDDLFVDVVAEGDGLYIELDDSLKCYVTHYPTCSKIDAFNLVGHIHSAWKVQPNALNVGVDVHHYRPIDTKKIAFYYKAICDFYDRDVWVAYDAAQKVHAPDRGPKSSYLDSAPTVVSMK